VSVRKNKQGQYLVDITWPDKVRTRAKMPDKDTAERINKKIEVAIVDEERIWRKLRKELRLEQNQILTFDGFANKYFEDYVKVYNRDIRGKKNRLDALKSHFKKQSIESITLQSATQFLASKKKVGVKNATLNRYRALLRHMTSWAVEQDFLESNPLVKLKKLDEPQWVGIRPDESLIDDILETIDTRVLPIFVFIRETGCRRNEAISLRFDQIDFARQVVTFHTNTKSGKYREVPLTEEGLWSVQALPIQGETVFYHPVHLRPWTGDGLAIFWEKAREAVAVGDELTKKNCRSMRIHDLRHAYAIKLAEEECAMHYISEVMGHHSIDFTRNRYARFSPDSASRAVLRILQDRKAETGRNLAQNWHR